MELRVGNLSTISQRRERHATGGVSLRGCALCLWFEFRVLGPCTEHDRQAHRLHGHAAPADALEEPRPVARSGFLLKRIALRIITFVETKLGKTRRKLVRRT